MAGIQRGEEAELLTASVNTHSHKAEYETAPNPLIALNFTAALWNTVLGVISGSLQKDHEQTLTEVTAPTDFRTRQQLDNGSAPESGPTRSTELLHTFKSTDTNIRK